MADTGESLAAKRYAQAAFELAGSDLAGWQRAIEEIAEFMGDDEVRKVLENSRIPQEPKMRLVAAALSNLPAMQLNLARLLVRKKRTGLAPEIAVRHGRAPRRDPGAVPRPGVGARRHRQGARDDGGAVDLGGARGAFTASRVFYRASRGA